MKQNESERETRTEKGDPSFRITKDHGSCDQEIGNPKRCKECCKKVLIRVAAFFYVAIALIVILFILGKIIAPYIL
jgi:hypothetical protein